ncbi:MAG TPA: serine/threonine-protein kinase [Pseudomonadota bacterium]|nr:serine/threonine-protein kinase [Pseudomonadota bacterium]
MTHDRIGPYKIVRKIGEGGMGAVYEALQDPIGRRVAVKILHPKYAAEPSIAARFLNEARAVNLVDHPGVVQISDYGQMPDGTAYLVMEFLKGETLSQRVKRPGGLGLPDIVRLARQIASALAAAHEKNIFHRDLKPDNVMLMPDPDADMPGRERVKLLDFGIAKVAQAENDDKNGGQAPKTATDVVMGTPRYMAPEQCRGGVAIDGKADVYSLGVMLYEMVSGRPPFSGGSGEVLAMHIYETPPPLKQLAPHLPDELTNLIHRLLAKKKEERPTMAETQTALDQLAIRHPTSVLQAIKLTPAMLGAMSTPSGSQPHLTPAGTSAPPSTMGLSAGQATVAAPSSGRRVVAGGIALLAICGVTLGLWRGLHDTPKVEKDQPTLAPVVNKPPDPPRRVHWTLTSNPPGAEVVRKSDDKVLGTTPWNGDDVAGEGQLEVRLRLTGYAEKVVQLDRATDQKVSELLEALPKRPVRPVGPSRPGRPGVTGPGRPTTGVNKPSGPSGGKDEQPRIVD